MPQSLEKGKISSTQFMFLVINQAVAYAIIVSTGIDMKQDAWLVILLGIAVIIGAALIYLALANRFPGKSYIAIHDIVWGPYLGKLYSALFLLFLFHATTIASGIFIDFQKEFLLTTPPLVIALFGIGVAALLASRGLEVLARCCHITMIFYIIIWGFLFVMMFPQIKPTNFQPVLQTPLPKLLIAALKNSAFLGIGYTFLIIFPFVADSRNTIRALILGFTIAGALLLMGIIWTIGVLGPAAGYFVYPALHASRLINIAETFTRMEVFAGIIFWTGGLITTAAFLYNVGAATGELLGLKKISTLMVPFWILCSLISTHNFPNISENLFNVKIFPWIYFPFQFILPLLTLLIAAIRKLPRKSS